MYTQRIICVGCIAVGCVMTAILILGCGSPLPTRREYDVRFKHAVQTYQRYMRGDMSDGLEQAANRLSWILADPDHLECIPRRVHMDHPWLWFIFKPMYACAHEERIGSILDGGKWICYIPTSKTCVVYSFGAAGNADFEDAISGRAPRCEIHTFDPTVNDKHANLPPSAQFHVWGVAGKTGEAKIGSIPNAPVKTIGDTMVALKHSHIHILKIDVEGSEYDVSSNYGVLVRNPVNNLHMFRAAMRAILSKTDQELHTMGSNGRIHILSHFNFNTFASRLLDNIPLVSTGTSTETDITTAVNNTATLQLQDVDLFYATRRITRKTRIGKMLQKSCTDEDWIDLIETMYPFKLCIAKVMDVPRLEDELGMQCGQWCIFNGNRTGWVISPTSKRWYIFSDESHECNMKYATINPYRV